jgi:DNA-binding transcriptional ArsR family regulator
MAQAARPPADRTHALGVPAGGWQMNEMRKARVEIGSVLNALGDPTRRAIVDRLREGPLSVSALAGPLQITLTAVGQHLQVLEESRLVFTEKIGRIRICRLEPTGFLALQQWVQDLRSTWERRLDRLGGLLAEETE